jgi:glucokinase
VDGGTVLIAGDIGGTKTLLGLYAPGRDVRQPIEEREFHSASFPGLEDVVRKFLAEVKQPVTAASFDVAGPVRGGRAHLTNLPWVIEEAQLARELGLRQVSLLNDLEAIAYAVPRLHEDELHTINIGEPNQNGPIAIVAPGTGLGEAFLIWNGSSYIPCASEGGHAGFAPTDSLEAELWGYLHRRYGHVSYERVCSGSGIPNIYDGLRELGEEQESPEVAAQLAGLTDRTPLIMQRATEGTDPLCVGTLNIFTAALGAEAGNLAIKILASGGVYLAGGIPPRILPQLSAGGFMRAFVAKGRMSDLLRAMPVKVVLVNAALLGVALYGLDRMQQRDL